MSYKQKSILSIKQLHNLFNGCFYLQFIDRFVARGTIIMLRV